jgi:hypothetical protein
VFKCAIPSVILSDNDTNEDWRHTLDPQCANLIKVLVVDMCVYPEQPTQDRLGGISECRRELDSCPSSAAYQEGVED